MKPHLQLVFILSFLCLFVSCGFGAKKSSHENSPPTSPSGIPTLSSVPAKLPTPVKNTLSSAPTITVMTWNVENLYDAVDDPLKDDDTYLPLHIKKQIPNHIKNCMKLSAKSWRRQCIEWDWTDSVVEEKLSRLARVILSVNDGKGPDVLALQEVENIELLERLIEDHMPGHNYKAYLIENNDLRGIDVGVITRLPVLGTPQNISLGSSRPALKLTLELPDKNKLFITAVHFPMASTSIERRLRLLSNATKVTSADLQIILGDFNFPRDEMESHQIANSYLFPNWAPAHLYCSTCLGTTYENFTKTWSFLDMILLHKQFFSASSPWVADVDSFRIHNPFSFQKDYYGNPADFELPWMHGVSDHWPMMIQLVKIF